MHIIIKQQPLRYLCARVVGYFIRPIRRSINNLDNFRSNCDEFLFCYLLHNVNNRLCNQRIINALIFASVINRYFLLLCA